MISGADKILEFGMLKFEYGQDRQIYRILDSFVMTKPHRRHL
jgi:hypothetical protein